jgi:gamma-glutamyltranspeptidase / glutathione hydrolase
MAQPAVIATRREAIQAGEAVLAEGGNAIDAAVAMSFVMGVVEPYNNGIGGFGEIVYRAPDGSVSVVDAAARVHPTAASDMFEVVGQPTGLYGWPAVRDDANIVGPLAVTAPRLVAGLELAHGRFGTREWASLVEPAIAIAESGVEVDYMSAAVIAHEMPTLSLDALATELYFPFGWPPAPPVEGPPLRLPNPRLADALRAIAAEGAEAMREGPIRDQICRAVASGGKHALQAEGLQNTEAELVTELPALVTYRGWSVYGSTRASGATTAAQILGILDHYDGLDSLSTTDRYRVIAHVSRRAFEDRLAFVSGSSPTADLQQLLSGDHLLRCAAAVRDRLNGSSVLGEPGQSVGRATSTTHFSAVDSDGGAVSLTQTLLALYGAHVGVVESGFFLNNAMMWFDPRPNTPNSIAPGRRALSAVSPVILVSPDNSSILTVGAHGARRIISAVAQIVDAVVAMGLSVQESVNRPRVHAEVSHATVDERLGTDLVETLQRDGLNAGPAHYGPTSLSSARACAIRCDLNGSSTTTGLDRRSSASWRFGYPEET